MKRTKKLGTWLMASALVLAGAGMVRAETTVAKIEDKGEYATLDAAFGAAASGDTVVILAGTHDCTAEAAFANLATKTVTLKGVGQADVILDMGTGNKTGVQTTPGTSLTLEEMTLKFNHVDAGSPMYHHTFYHPASQTFRKVAFIGQVSIMDYTLFDNCTFTNTEENKDEYLLWCYGCTAELIDCKFTGSGTKAPIKLYNEGLQCGLKIAETSFEKLGSKNCAVYSTNKYPDNNVYEITVGENVTAPEGKKLIRSSDVGLTVINPTKDENGKYTGGTFESEGKSSEEIVALAGKYVSEGFGVAINADGSIGVYQQMVTLKIPAATTGYSYIVSNATKEITGELVNGTNNYVIASNDTVLIYFTLDEDYVFDGEVTNPRNLGAIETDTVIDATQMPKVVSMFVAEVTIEGETKRFLDFTEAWKKAHGGRPGSPATLKLLRDISLTNTMTTVTQQPE